MNYETSGFESITTIPAGSTVKRVYWTKSSQFGYVGGAHDSQHAVLEESVAERKELLAKLQPGDFRPDRIVIDLRWTVEYPEGHPIGGSIDLAVHSVQYPTLADAVEHLALLKKWSKVS